MTHHEVEQRIKYLVEHGGVWDDPIEDIRKTARLAVVLSAATLGAMLLVVFVFHG